MRILGLMEDPEGPSARLRFHCYTEPASHRGATLSAVGIPHGFRAQRRLFASADQFDVVFLQRRLLLPWQLRFLRRRTRRLIYDLDDALAIRDREPFDSWTRGTKFRVTVRQADRTLAGNQALQRLVQKFGGASTRVPTLLPWLEVPEIPRVPHRALWIGQPSTFRYLHPLLDSWQGIVHRFPALHLEVVGSGRNLDLGGVSFTAWSPQEEARALAQASLGLAPLPKNRWTEGKCGARLLGYLRAGLSALASPVGSQAEIAERVPGVRIVTNQEEWAIAFEDFARGEAPVSDQPSAIQGRAESEYGVDRWFPSWFAAVTGAGEKA